MTIKVIKTYYLEINGKKTKHFEILSCGHQCNLLNDGRDDGKGDKLKRESGVCPKGDK